MSSQDAPRDDQRNEPTMDPQDPRHERLCAYLFDELEGDARAAFEEELAGSPELRAEKAKLEATLSLVQTALPTESLPPEVHADLEKAARREGGGTGLRLLRGGGARRLAAAAAVLLMTGATYVVWHETRPGLIGTAPDRMAASSAPAERRRDAGELRNIGYVDEAQGRSTQEDGLQHLGYTDEQLVTLRTLGYGGASHADDLSQLENLGYTGGSAEVAEAPATPGLELGARFEAEPAPAEAPPTEAPFLAGAPIVRETKARSRGPASPGPGSPGPGAPVTTLGLPATKTTPAAPATSPPPPGRAGGREGKRSFADDVDGFELERTMRKRGEDADGEEQAYPFLSLIQSDAETSGEDDARRQGRRARPLTPEELAAARQRAEQAAEVDAERMIVRCGLQVGETPREMFFRHWGDHPFVLTNRDPLSTFSVDVDTASYTLTRRHLASRRLPDPARVRTEEFVNYFDADRPAPPPGETFAIDLEAAPSPFGADPDLELLRVTVRGQDVHVLDRQPLALTFVVDVSGSMKENGSLAGESRLDLVKHSLELLMRNLSGTDSLALVTFNNEARVVVPPTPAGARGVVEDALFLLAAKGGTSVEAGLTEGFRLAAENLVPHAVNRVVFLSDGVGNIGETDQAKILELVAEHKDRGVYLNTIGLGFENHDSDFLEELADRGDGVCSYVDSRAEAEKAFVDDFTKTLQPIARDVKIQVEFDPAQVRRFRQLGYENRALAHSDFRNDAVDAGEVNAGHQVSALYEIERRPGAQGLLATVRVSYKPQHAVDGGDPSASGRRWADKSVEIERSFGTAALAPDFQAASPGYRRSALVAQFAEVLRESVHARGDSWKKLVAWVEKLEPELGEPEFTEFAALLARAEPLVEERRLRATPEVDAALDRLRMLQFERTQRELVEKDEDPERVAREAEAIEAAEAELREAVRQQYLRPYKPSVR